MVITSKIKTVATESSSGMMRWSKFLKAPNKYTHYCIVRVSFYKTKLIANPCSILSQWLGYQSQNVEETTVGLWSVSVNDMIDRYFSFHPNWFACKSWPQNHLSYWFVFRYMSQIDRALRAFEYTTEWADLIAALDKLNRVLLAHQKYPIIPR